MQTYQWIARNEPIRVQAGGVDVATFTYDGFGRRIATRDPAGRTIQQVWLGTPKRPREGGCACGSLDALIEGHCPSPPHEVGRATRLLPHMTSCD